MPADLLVQVTFLLDGAAEIRYLVAPPKPGKHVHAFGRNWLVTDVIEHDDRFDVECSPAAETSTRRARAPVLTRDAFGDGASGQANTMANPAPVGSDVSAGSYRCTNCGYELDTRSTKHLPPCPNCQGPYAWEAMSGGDSPNDPYPDRDR